MVDYTNAAGYITDSSGRRQFQNRDDANGIPGTSIVDEDLNQERNSLVDLVKAAGITPAAEDDTQITQAVQFFAKKIASGAVMGTPGVLASGDVAGILLYYSAVQTAPVFVYGTTTVALVTTTALSSALGGYLPLAGGNVTGTMDWGSIAAAGTVKHRFWSAGAPAEGDATPDATLTMSGGVPGTPNRGTLSLSTGLYDLSATQQVWVPDISAFTGLNALNARTAEARYVPSAPPSGSTRISNIYRDSTTGRLYSVGTDGSIFAYALQSELTTAGTFTNGHYTKTPFASGGFLLKQNFLVPSATDTALIVFPLSFSSPPVPPQLTMALNRDVDIGTSNVTATGFNIMMVGSGTFPVVVTVEGFVSA